jgi:hypothetical protein
MRNAVSSDARFTDGQSVGASESFEIVSRGLIIEVLVLGLIAAGCGPPS